MRFASRFHPGGLLAFHCMDQLIRQQTENTEILPGGLSRYLNGSTPARKLRKFGLAKRPGV